MQVPEAFISASARGCHSGPTIIRELCVPARKLCNKLEWHETSQKRGGSDRHHHPCCCGGDAALAADVAIPQAEYNVNPPVYYEPEVLVPYERPLLYGYPPPPPSPLYRSDRHPWSSSRYPFTRDVTTVSGTVARLIGRTTVGLSRGGPMVLAADFESFGFKRKRPEPRSEEQNCYQRADRSERK